MSEGSPNGGRGRPAAVGAPLLALLLAGCGPRPPLPIANPLVPRGEVGLGPGVDPTTMDRKLLLGYQGWFGCPDDGSPLRRWEHWFRRDRPAQVSTVRVDLWPDVSELDPDERCRTPLTLPSGQAAEVYSAYNPKTVDRHFRWMEDHGLAGVFLQRFVIGLILGSWPSGTGCSATWPRGRKATAACSRSCTTYRAPRAKAWSSGWRPTGASWSTSCT